MTKADPVVFKSWENPKLPTPYSLSFLARAATAGPTYFMPAIDHKNEAFIDAGIFANFPDIFCERELRKTMKDQNEKILHVSLRASHYTSRIQAKNIGKGGLLGWLGKLQALVFQTQRRMVEYINGKENLVPSDANSTDDYEEYVGRGSTTSYASFTKSHFGEYYIFSRYKMTLSLAVNAPKRCNTLRFIAEQYFNTKENRTILDRLVEQLSQD